MATNEYQLSDAARRALNAILASGAFDTDTPIFLLNDVLAYLKEMEELTEDEIALKSELNAMPAQARESLSRAIAATRRRK